MPFDRPTLQEIDDRIQSDIGARIEDSATFLRRSVLKVMSRVYSGAIHLQYGYMQYMKDQLFLLTADSEFLEKIGTEYGIPRTDGTKATGSGTASGTNGTSIPAGTRLQSDSDNIYIVDTAATISGGVATVDVTAEESGDDSNEAAGTILSFVSPIIGVDSTITIDSSGITGGLDIEGDEAYRSRLLTRKRQPPHGGAEFDYEAWAKEVSGVTRAWTIPLYQGVGTLGFAFVRDDDDDLIPSAAEVAAVRSYILSHSDPLTNVTVGIPVTAEPGFFMISLTKLAINMTIAIDPNTAAVQASVLSRLNDAIRTYGGPGENVALSQLYEAVGSAVGEIKHRIISPITDTVASTSQVQVLGDVTFQDY